MRISPAHKYQASVITRLIMLAMDYDCCRYFAGNGHTLEEFESMMTKLVESEESQYSYLNTMVALNDNKQVMGICISYDGKDLHRLRAPFINAAKESFGLDYSNIDDETQTGELYVDSLAVSEAYRHQGIASSLLMAAIDKAEKMDIPAVGLLVDKGNPKAERLYNKIGFEYINDTTWGGHRMKHLQFPVKVM